MNEITNPLCDGCGRLLPFPTAESTFCSAELYRVDTDEAKSSSQKWNPGIFLRVLISALILSLIFVLYLIGAAFGGTGRSLGLVFGLSTIFLAAWSLAALFSKRK